MIKKEDGVMTIDATISLTLFAFFVLFIMDIGTIYQAQNYVYHGMLQTTKKMAVYTYEISVQETYETNTEKVATRLLQLFGIEDNNLVQEKLLRDNWKKDDIQAMAEFMYPYCTSGSKENAEKYLAKYGVRDGLAGINFDGSEKKGKDIILKATYTIELPWPVFGIEDIKLKQSTRSRTWG